MLIIVPLFQFSDYLCSGITKKPLHPRCTCLEEFPVRDEAISVHVVDGEDKLQLLLAVLVANSKLC